MNAPCIFCPKCGVALDGARGVCPDCGYEFESLDTQVGMSRGLVPDRAGGRDEVVF